METFGDILPTENHSTTTMAPTKLSDLTNEDIAGYSASFKESLTPPGHMEVDEAKKYMAQIVTLFNMPEMDVQIALGGWSALHDVGAVQNFADKPPIVCGSVSMPATKVYGDIIEVSEDGKPRRFCATMFEKDIDVLLKIFPQLSPMLAARCAKAGLPASNPKAVISFLKGVTPATVGTNVARVQAKDLLLMRNAKGINGSGAAIAAGQAAQAVVTEVMPSSGHNLWNQ
jgi:hypothetical protein